HQRRARGGAAAESPRGRHAGPREGRGARERRHRPRRSALADRRRRRIRRVPLRSRGSDPDRRECAVNGLLARVFTSRLFWPVVLLLVLFAINVIAFPGFLSITVRDGNLYGSLIDILRNGAPMTIIAIGMTLVIATQGIDLSVGAIAAIAGAVACSILLGAPDPVNPGTVAVAILTAVAISLVLGAWNGFLVAVVGI